MAVLADDDVIMDGNAEGLGGIGDHLRHVDIGPRRRWIAGGWLWITFSHTRSRWIIIAHAGESLGFEVVKRYYAEVPFEELGAGDWEMEIEGYYAHTSCALSDLIESAATIALLAISFAAFLAQQFSLWPQVQIPPRRQFNQYQYSDLNGPTGAQSLWTGQVGQRSTTFDDTLPSATQ